MVGFGQRVKNELERLAVKGTKIKIFAPPERKYTTWIGGSILAALGTFRKVSSFLARSVLISRCGLVQKNTRKIQRYLSQYLIADVRLSIARQFSDLAWVGVGDFTRYPKGKEALLLYIILMSDIKESIAMYAFIIFYFESLLS